MDTGFEITSMRKLVLMLILSIVSLNCLATELAIHQGDGVVYVRATTWRTIADPRSDAHLVAEGWKMMRKNATLYFTAETVTGGPVHTVKAEDATLYMRGHGENAILLKNGQAYVTTERSN